MRSILSQAAPTADEVNAVFSGVRDSLPQTLANLEVVFDMLKRYHAGVEQLLVFLPQGAAIAQTVLTPTPGAAQLPLAPAINYPPPCLTGFLPASEWRSPADTSPRPLPSGTYCKIPQDAQLQVRGARNIPCVDVPGKRAATPKECRSKDPYVPLGTNPWFGDPNQILTCPAPGARCDQPVKPGLVIPAPSINTGLNPAPADQVQGTPPPVSDPLQRPGSGTVQSTGSSLTRASTLQHRARRRSIARPAVNWWGRMVSSTPSQTRAQQETTDGRRCWRRPAEPCRCE